MQTELRGVKKFSIVLDYKIEWEYKIIRKEKSQCQIMMTTYLVSCN